MSFRSLLRTLAALAGLAAAAAQAQVVFSDPQFGSGPYTIDSRIYDGSVTLGAGQCPACGPAAGPALRITALYATDGFYALTLLNTAFVYDPSAHGAVQSLDAQADKNLFADFIPVELSSTFRPLIAQGGKLYAAALAGPSLIGALSTGYATIAGSGLHASDFQRLDFDTGDLLPESPDFAGGAMTFGLLQFGSLVGAQNSLVGADYANYRIALHVPEPGTWALTAIGLLAAAGLARRRAARG